MNKHLKRKVKLITALCQNSALRFAGCDLMVEPYEKTNNRWANAVLKLLRETELSLSLDSYPELKYMVTQLHLKMNLDGQLKVAMNSNRGAGTMRGGDVYRHCGSLVDMKHFARQLNEQYEKRKANKKDYLVLNEEIRTKCKDLVNIYLTCRPTLRADKRLRVQPKF